MALRNQNKIILIFLKIFLIITAFSQSACADKTHTCNLTRIKDGDTLVCSDKYTALQIRLADINAPEIDTKAGVLAKKALEKILPLGTKLKLTIYGIDKYERSVATIYKGNLDVNKQMLKLGMAEIFFKYLHQDKKESYIVAQNYARKHKLGIWAKN